MKFRPSTKRADKANAIDLYLTEAVWEDEEEGEASTERKEWEQMFEQVPARLSKSERKEWMDKLDGVALGSDAFFPFTDNVRRAAKSGVKYLAAPGGSVMDSAVFKAADEAKMVFCKTNLRLFHH